MSARVGTLWQAEEGSGEEGEGAAGEEGEAEANIKMVSVEVMSREQSPRKSPFCLRLVTSSRDWYFEGDNQQDCALWYQNLSEAISLHQA